MDNLTLKLRGMSCASCASSIEQAIQSVINQNYPNLEYIIIDGGSTDNTVEIIKKYESHISYWISEPDKGQTDAINKGFAKCTGEIFNWLNSDDYYETGTFKKLSDLNDYKVSGLFYKLLLSDFF